MFTTAIFTTAMFTTAIFTTKHIRTILFTAAVLAGFSSAIQAKPITGYIGFDASGEILRDTSTGLPAAYNSLDDHILGNEAGTCHLPGPFPDCSTGFTTASGSIADMILAGGGPPVMYMPDDFYFAPTAVSDIETTTTGTTTWMKVDGTPGGTAVEWVLGPVADSFGVTGVLQFILTSGGATDTSNPSLLDLSGEGYFVFKEDSGTSEYTDGGFDTAGNLNDVSKGYWTLSDNGHFTITASNVPAPAALGLLGLGLVAMGIVRRRRGAT